MGQKVHPIGFRLGGVYTWSSRWFLKHASYRDALRSDLEIRKYLRTRLKEAALAKIDVERSANSVTVTLMSGKPGVIIGRGGQGVEALRKEIKDRFVEPKTTLTINIQEVDKPNLSAALVTQGIIADIEKRIPFRRAMKQALGRLAKAGAEGAKIVVGGRLDGAEIARVEKMSQGKIPLHTIRANIDYSRGAAQTTYGVIGVKVWIYKGDMDLSAPAPEVSTEAPRRARRPMNNRSTNTPESTPYAAS